MNIAIINSMSNTTSTGKIAFGLHSYLKAQGHRSRIYYGRKDPGAEGNDDLIRFCSEAEFRCNALLVRLFGAEGLYAWHATKRLLALLEQDPPDAVYLLNLHAYYLNFPMLFDYLGKRQIKTIYLMLDEAPFLGKCCFSFSCERYKAECGHCPLVRDYPKSLFFDRSRLLFRKKREAYAKVRDLTFVGIPYTVEKARGSALLRNAHLVELDEAVNLRELYYPHETSALRERVGIPGGNRIILTVSPYSNPRKGGRFFLRVAELLAAQKDLTFVYVGYDGEEKECPPNLIPISYVSDQNELAEYYSLGDLFVCTSLAETVANTCLEALSCGTPLLGFRICGIPYSADAPYGTFVAPEDVDGLAEAIRNTPPKTAERSAACRHYAESRYDAQQYYERLASLTKEPFYG